MKESGVIPGFRGTISFPSGPLSRSQRSGTGGRAARAASTLSPAGHTPRRPPCRVSRLTSGRRLAGLPGRRPSDNQEVGAEVTSGPQAPSRVTKCPACASCPPGPARRLSGSTRGARGHHTHFLRSGKLLRLFPPARPREAEGARMVCGVPPVRAGLTVPYQPRAPRSRRKGPGTAHGGSRCTARAGPRHARRAHRHVRVCPASSREPPSPPASQQCSLESFRNHPGPQSSTTPPGSGDDRPLRGCCGSCRLAATLVARSRLSRRRV